MSRRTMVVGLGTLGAAAVAATVVKVPAQIAPTIPGTWWTPTMAASLAAGSMSQWTAQIGKTFGLPGVAGGTTLTLEKVVALDSSGKRPKTLARQTAFLAVFKPAKALGAVTDKIYALGDAKSAMNVYLSPDDTGRLQAVFN